PGRAAGDPVAPAQPGPPAARGLRRTRPILIAVLDRGGGFTPDSQLELASRYPGVMVPSARSGEPATPGISGGAPIISGPITAATGRAPDQSDSRRRWMRRTATAVDASL